MSSLSLLQFSALVFVEFVALMVVAAPLVQVQAQVTLPVFLNAHSAPYRPNCALQPRHHNTISYFLQVKCEKTDNYCGCLMLLRGAAGRRRG